MSKRIPEHIAIIMDGNGRWAKRRGLPRVEGHRRGADSVRTVTRAARELGIKKLTLYAFSEQNWGRPSIEVKSLMELLRDYLISEYDEIMDNGVRLTTIGSVHRLPGFVRKQLDKIMHSSSSNSGMELTLALSYGAREDLTAVVRRVAKRVSSGELKVDDITEALISDELGNCDADLIIRTSGEKRLSNFLLWQAAYAELYFTETLWPDFGKAELIEALDVYARRDRRFGLVKTA